MSVAWFTEIAVADIFREVDEEVRRDQASQYWKKYGRHVIAGLVAVILGTSAYVGWKEYDKRQRIKDSEAFLAALTLIQEGKAGEAKERFAALAGESAAGYAMLSRFRAAALLGQSGDLRGAADAFDTIARDGSVDPLYARLADLYYVLYTIESGDPQELAGRLAPLLADDGPWRYSARELSAVLAIRTGDPEKARTEYTRLADDATAPPGIRARAAEMLRALGKS